MRVMRSIKPKLLILLLVAVSGLGCDADPDQPKSEIEQLKSKLASLESRYIDLEKEIRAKDEKLSLLEKNIEFKCTKVSSLASEIKQLQNTSVDIDESVQKANARNDILEKKVERLQSKLEKQVGKREALEEKVFKTEQTAQQLARRLEYAKKIKERQRLKFQQLERNLDNAQNELSELQARENVIAEEIEKVHGVWIPYWLTSPVHRLQETFFRNWNKLERSVWEELVPKVLEKWTNLMVLVRPHMELASNAAYSKTSDVYKICVDAITPRFIKVKQTMQPHFQRVKKFFEPYFGRASRCKITRVDILV